MAVDEPVPPQPPEETAEEQLAEEGVPDQAAAEYVQDDEREKRLRTLFGLVKPQGSGRGGTDAVLVLPAPDGRVVEFELKSATRSGITTARDVGPDHLRKWRGKHWLIGFFDAGGAELKRCLYASPEQMEPWIARIEAKIRLDFELAQVARAVARELYEALLVRQFGDKEVYPIEDARAIQKMQYSTAEYRKMMDRENGYSKARMLEILADRWVYLTERGATLNNPHIGLRYSRGFKELPIDVQDEAVQALREAVLAVIGPPPAQGERQPPAG